MEINFAFLYKASGLEEMYVFGYKITHCVFVVHIKWFTSCTYGSIVLEVRM